MEIKTKVDSPNPKASTLRSIIPIEVINTLSLEKGDSINWIINAIGENELQVTIEKLE